MILRPCLRCHRRVGCARRDDMRARLKGSGVTTASFRCRERLVGLEPGRRVMVKIYSVEADTEYGPDLVTESLPGTVICPSKKSPWKIVIRLDEASAREAGIENRYVKVWPDNCTPLDEMRALCPINGCEHPLEDDGACRKTDWHDVLLDRQDAAIDSIYEPRL